MIQKLSISSRVRFFVSGTKREVKIACTKHMPARNAKRRGRARLMKGERKKQHDEGIGHPLRQDRHCHSCSAQRVREDLGDQRPENGPNAGGEESEISRYKNRHPSALKLSGKR